MKKLLFTMMAAFAIAGCSKDDNGDTITVPNQTQLTQTVYADDNAGTSGVAFTTTGAWSSSITESASARSTKANAPEWISVSPSSGDKAGNYTLQISLSTNLSGVKRSATVNVNCNGQNIAISITQEATKEDGELPDEAVSGNGTFTSTNGVSVNIIKANHSIASNKSVLITFESEDKDTDGKSDESFFVNMYNPLSNGRLAEGQYNSTTQLAPYADRTFTWTKSSLSGGYSNGGTIQVAISGDVYTFTLDVSTDSGETITGSYSGRLLYLNEEIRVSEVKLDKTELNLEVNSYATLSATVLPENALNKAISWSSSNPTVATVTENGFIAAIKAGTTTITATSEDGGKSAQCVVTVSEVISTGSGTFTNDISNNTQSIVKVTHEARSFNNVKLQFYAADNYSAFNLIFNKNLTNGRLTPGTYNFALDGQEQGTVVGEKPYHIANATAQNGTVTVAATGDIYTVTLDMTGIYYPPKEAGVACKITGSYSGKFVYVNEFISVTGVSLNKTTLEIEKGKSETLTATILPANASHKNILWTSSNPSVASVYNGQVSAQGVGSTTITALTEDGGKIASCVVTVKPREVTGSGLFTYKFDDNSDTSTFSPTYVEDTGGTIRFKDEGGFEAIYFHYTTPSKGLEAGVYEWKTGSSSSRTWQAQKGEFGKMQFYCEGVATPGTVTVAKSGDTYTITLNWNVSETGNGGRSGKITGTYTGKIKIAQ